MVKWLQEVACQLSGSNNEYRPCTLYEIFLDRDDKKIPDVVLFKAGEHYPLVAVGVGFAEPLDKLFHDAERIMKGSWGRTALVIIVKVSESKQHTKDESPWGLASDHATLRKLYLDDKLDLKIEAYYDKKGLNIISDLEAKVYIYPSTRKSSLGYLSTSTIANPSKPPPISHQLSQLMGGRLICPSKTFMRRSEREKQTRRLGAFIV